MHGKTDYTTLARVVVRKFPVGNYIFTQIFFWISAYLILAVISYFLFRTAGNLLLASFNLRASLVVAISLGFFTGLASGITDQIFERRIFYNKALGLVILFKAIISFIVFVILISVVRYKLYPYFESQFSVHTGSAGLEESWEHFFQLLLIFNSITGLIISFINQVNKKYGPGVLIPLLLGRYQKPREESRVFLFMDLKSSTTIAEQLGHLKYSSFIRDSIMDISSLLIEFTAQVYQYVGDEIVLTWSMKKGRLPISAVQFFFACEQKFEERSPYYLKEYGQTPMFKAGLHMGKVTAVEVGDIKRDIAYHGDTLNTASRIQSICNEKNRSFLASGFVIENSAIKENYTVESMGMILLKGKQEPVEVFSIVASRQNT